MHEETARGCGIRGRATPQSDRPAGLLGCRGQIDSRHGLIASEHQQCVLFRNEARRQWKVINRNPFQLIAIARVENDYVLVAVQVAADRPSLPVAPAITRPKKAPTRSPLDAR